jgi:uncharacterized protein YgbK (DUF1537 family)
LSHHPWATDQGIVVAVVASPTPANDRQVEMLKGHDGVMVVDCDPRQPIDRLRITDDLRAATWAVVLDTTTIQDDRQTSEGLSASAAKTARFIAETLESLGKTCVGFVVTGGEAAGHLVEELSASAVVAEREVESLCPLGRLVGGTWDGVSIVTKGGVIGNPRTLLHLIEVAHFESALLAESSSAEEEHV